MYASFFGLKHEPFSIAPDPRYLFMSERHREALAHLLYGVTGGGGFVLLSGEIGAGKTTVCRCFLEQIPRRCNVGYIFNPKLTVIELLQSVCEEFGIPQPRPGVRGGALTVKDYLDPLNQFLLKTHAVGQNNVLVIDEAQMLSADVLEQLRLLTNLETSERKLLQVILIGQPELRDLLARPELEQLAQRVIARYHLGALTEAETERYIRHRLAVAGLSGAPPFDARAIQRIHQLAAGVPRRINLLCDRALLGAYASGRHAVDRAIVDRAAAEVFGEERGPAKRRATASARRGWAGAGLAVAGLALVASVAGFAIGAWQRAGPAVMVAGAATGGTATGASAPVAIGPGAAASAGAATGRSAAAAPASGAIGRAAENTPPAAAPPTYLTAADLRSRFDTLTRDEREAWRALAPAWWLAADETDPCAAAPRSEVHCWRSANSTLALIRQLDRPGILVLRDESDRPVYALLTGLTADTATLKIGRTTQTLALISLASLWRGDFATFWRVPPGYAGKPIDANAGPVAAWLGSKLAVLNSQPAPGSEAEWRTRVSAFQRAQGLKPDGLAGPTTFMQLNRATGVDEPRLSRGTPAADALPRPTAGTARPASGAGGAASASASASSTTVVTSGPAVTSTPVSALMSASASVSASARRGLASTAPQTAAMPTEPAA